MRKRKRKEGGKGRWQKKSNEKREKSNSKESAEAINILK
jgi:hypothetical protein